MARPKRADEADCVYHALIRGNARCAIFNKEADYRASERILAEGLERFPCRILSYLLMPHHWHFALQPTDPELLSAWPIARLPQLGQTR